MRRVICALLAASVGLGVPLVPSSARADSPKAEAVEQLSREATKKYRAKDYQGAIEKFKEAYAIEPVPNLLFNIAKCYEKLEDWDNAIDHYQKFVVEDVDKDARKKAMERIDELNEVKAALAEREKPEETPAETAVQAEKTEESATAQPPADEGADRTWAYVSLGGGAALLAGGAVFGLLASQQQTEFEQSTSTQEKLDARDSGETMALVADSFYVAGAILVGVGIVLFVTSDGDDGQEVAASTFGWFDGNGGGVGLRGQF